MFSRINRTLVHWRSSHSSLPGVWQLFKQSLGAYRNDWRLYYIILLIVLVPTSLLSNYVVDPSSDSTLSAYITLANSIMNVALIWAVIQRYHQRKISPKQAYYKSSSALLRLLLFVILVGLMLIPLLIGVIIFSLAITEPNELLSIFEKAMLVILAVIFALPSLTMLTRAVFGLYTLVETDQGPIEAIRTSRNAVRGRALAVFGRLAGLVLCLVLMLIIPIVLLVVASTFWQSLLALTLLQIIIGLIALPLSNIYLYRLYRELA
jgi:hypothetical protein